MGGVDIQNDPHETANPVALPEHEEVLQMRAQVQQWREDTDDLWLISDQQAHLQEMGRLKYFYPKSLLLNDYGVNHSNAVR